VGKIAQLAGKVFDAFLRAAVLFLISLRYRVRVRGLKEVTAKGTTGILFLPNHPAFIDPFIVLSRLSKRLAPRSLADRDQIDRFFIRWIAKRFGSRPIPDASKYRGAREEIDKALLDAVEALRNGGNFLFYPAGRIYRSYLEDLGGNSAVETILERLPDVRIVLVRTRGLWGSMFSRASGHHPVVPECIGHAVKSLLLSGILFAPRRPVTIELHEPQDFPRFADRGTRNRYMEAFYNRDAPHNTYVPYTIWEGGGIRELPEVHGEREAATLDDVPLATREAVTKHLSEVTGVSSIKETDALGRDLGLDSLSRVDLMLWLEKEFAVTGVDTEGLQTVADVMLAAAGHAVSVGPERLKAAPPRWFAAERLAPIAGEKITDTFLYQAMQSHGRIVAADQTSGAKTYRDLVLAILVLKREFERLPGTHLGIMLPASVATDVAYFAALFAGKTPVMVNWTVGMRNMTHSLELLGVRYVVTAKPLVTKVEFQAGDLGELKKRFLYLEDVAAKTSKALKVLAWLKSRFYWEELRSARVGDVAVVLFTSGSESLPKAVPLTHKNILTNIRDMMKMVAFRDDDRFIGIFPPFHSFGMTCTVILPLVAGIRVVYHPNPTEGAVIARIIEAYGATLLLGTPTFLAGIVRAAGEGQLSSLRLTVSGAEKCPESVYLALAKCCPQMKVLEGYGISECSPVVSANEEANPVPFTIGRILPSLEYVIVNVDTGLRVGPNEIGELFVRGDSVFGGYLKYDGPSPFVDFEGLQWYNTGDLVSEDAHGILTFAGRLKRFVKLGGEMISLPAVESVLDHYYPAGDEGPVIAVERAGSEEKPEIVLFTTLDLDRSIINDQIRKAGLSGLYSVRRIVKLDAVPVLGTGKTDYRALRAMLDQQRGGDETG